MKPLTPGQYVLSVLQQFPDNELTAADLLDWQGDDQRFDKIAIYNALSHLYAKGLVVKNQEGRATWWAVSETGLQGGEASPAPNKPRQAKAKASAAAVAKPVTAKVAKPSVAEPSVAEPAVAEAPVAEQAATAQAVEPAAAVAPVPPVPETTAAAAAPEKPPVRYPSNRYRGAPGS